MPLRRSPLPLRRQAVLYITDNLWDVVKKLFGIKCHLTFEEFADTEKGVEFVHLLITQDVRWKATFQLRIYLNKIVMVQFTCYLPRYAAPDVFGEGFDHSWLMNGENMLCVLCFRPKRLFITGLLHNGLLLMLLESYQFQNVEDLVCHMESVELPQCFFRIALKTMTNLVSVEGSLDDFMLTRLSDSCPKIKSIDTDRSVTDAALAALQKLKKLERLVTNRMSELSIAAIISFLGKAPQLKILETNICTTRVLAEIGEAKIPEFSCNLRELRCNCAWGLGNDSCTNWYWYPHNHLERDLVTIATLVCPFLSIVHLDNERIGDDEFLALIHLQEIHDLSVINRVFFPGAKFVTFCNGIVPILEKHGKGLSKLQLTGVDSVNAQVIAYTCPELKELVLEKTSSSNDWSESLQRPESVPVFTSLEEITVHQLQSIHSSQDHLTHWYTMFCDALVKVHISHSALLDDSMMDDILQSTQFPNLQSLDLMSCNKLSAYSLRKILRLNNPLKHLGFGPNSTETLLTEEDVSALEQFCQNYDLTCWFKDPLEELARQNFFI